MLLDLRSYQRPLLIFGFGVNYCRAEAVSFIERHRIPVALTWGAIDLLPTDHPLNLGGFGTHANRPPNFAVQNADFLLTIGTRLDSKSTGTPVESFAREARIMMVDIDHAETAKFKNRVTAFNIQALDFLREYTLEVGDLSEWRDNIVHWQAQYPLANTEPYIAVQHLSNEIPAEAIIVCDTGHTLAWMMQAFRFRGQRLLHPMNMTPMGCGLPMAIGAAFAHPGVPVALVTGDGGLQVNIQEWATVAHHRLPITTYLFNNRGHGMCRQTQTMWLKGEYPSTSHEGGLACPDFKAIASAYGVKLVEFAIPFDAELIPQSRFGKPLEDADPLLSREELAANMLIPLWPA